MIKAGNFFPSVENKDLKINAIVVAMPEDTHLVLYMQFDPHPNFRMTPKYNAFLWNRDYDFLLEDNKTPMQQTILEYFDVNVAHILKSTS